MLCVEAETDLMTLGYLGARQDDADRFVLWEMAGTSHADVYTFVAGFGDTGRLPIAELAAAWVPVNEFLGMKLDLPVNAGPQHYVMNAAVSHLDRWVRDGVRPPAAPRLEVVDGAFVTDEHGNVRGGIRTPHVDVPTAVLSGFGNGGDPVAFLAGRTTPFDAARLAALYADRADYLARFDGGHRRRGRGRLRARRRRGRDQRASPPRTRPSDQRGDRSAGSSAAAEGRFAGAVVEEAGGCRRARRRCRTPR